MATRDKQPASSGSSGRRAAFVERIQQIFQAFQMQRREDRLLLPMILAVFIGVPVVVFLLGLVWGMEWAFLPAGVALGLLGAVIVFGRRVQANVYRKAEGQPGAAGWALENLRGRWILAQAVAGTSQLDAVHRLIGRPGVVLVGEGAAHRVKSLLTQEKKRVSRLVGDTPIYEVVVGNDTGQIPLRRLHAYLTKLPRNINSGQMDELENRLNALASRGNPLPKGPVPPGAKMRNVQRAMRRR